MNRFRIVLEFDGIPNAGVIVQKAVAHAVKTQHGVKNIEISNASIVHGTPETGVTVCYTDGGCINNPDGPGGWAYRIERGFQDVLEGSGGVPGTTNNRMELMALLECYKALKPDEKAVVYTDSKYAREGALKWSDGWVNRGWFTSTGEPVKNKDLWQALRAVRIMKPQVEIRWVKGHSGNPGNDRCDQLATEAIKEQSKPICSSCKVQAKTALLEGCQQPVCPRGLKKLTDLLPL